MPVGFSFLQAILQVGSNWKPLETPCLVRDHCEVYRNDVFGSAIVLHPEQADIFLKFEVTR